ncbi:RAD55 family ATPase [Archaeoglobus profundus]|uniref:Circadian clock protein, KaiC n=1 Tax=Archaeoglobus profundus (strain DSM 5631 / JCM 9629 / NBRC 100127 / Av18) TaxID=572546 RepID=D2RHU7_ARCPA|nr:RAD55 family ATPase [Archaeoglobus profundus]ADB57872.1 putative circadian clock protein, KaiC [Archaeoglobus profundus DSM 5631]
MRVKTGVFGLDPLLSGGFLPNTINVVLGGTGVGKTIFTLQYVLQGLKNKECCLFVSFDMDEDDVIKTAENMGWDVRSYIEYGLLKIGKFIVEDITFLNNELINFILKSANGNVRIVIDSFTPLLSTPDYNVRKEVNWFFEQLRRVGTTVITIEEPLSGNLDVPSITLPAFLCDCLIHMKRLGYGEILDRTLRIVKHRNSWHAEGVFPYRIFKGLGIVVDSKHYVENIRKKMELTDIFSEEEVKSTPKELLEKIEMALMESFYHDEEVKHMIRWVVECYREFTKS